jgi:hypothetical protein
MAPVAADAAGGDAAGGDAAAKARAGDATVRVLALLVQQMSYALCVGT